MANAALFMYQNRFRRDTMVALDIGRLFIDVLKCQSITLVRYFVAFGICAAHFITRNYRCTHSGFFFSANARIPIF